MVTAVARGLSAACLVLHAAVLCAEYALLAVGDEDLVWDACCRRSRCGGGAAAAGSDCVCGPFWVAEPEAGDGNNATAPEEQTLLLFSRCVDCPSVSGAALLEHGLTIAMACVQAAALAAHFILLRFAPANAQFFHVTIGFVDVATTLVAAADVLLIEQTVTLACEIGYVDVTPSDHCYWLVLPPAATAALLAVSFCCASEGERDIWAGAEGTRDPDAPGKEQQQQPGGPGYRGFVVVSSPEMLPVRAKAPRDFEHGAAAHTAGLWKHRRTRRFGGVVDEEAEQLAVRYVAAAACAAVAKARDRLALRKEYWQVPFVAAILKRRQRPTPFLSTHRRAVLTKITGKIRCDNESRPWAVPTIDDEEEVVAHAMIASFSAAVACLAAACAERQRAPPRMPIEVAELPIIAMNYGGGASARGFDFSSNPHGEGQPGVAIRRPTLEPGVKLERADWAAGFGQGRYAREDSQAYYSNDLPGSACEEPVLHPGAATQLNPRARQQDNPREFSTKAREEDSTRPAWRATTQTVGFLQSTGRGLDGASLASAQPNPQTRQQDKPRGFFKAQEEDSTRPARPATPQTVGFPQSVNRGLDDTRRLSLGSVQPNPPRSRAAERQDSGTAPHIEQPPPAPARRLSVPPPPTKAESPSHFDRGRSFSKQRHSEQYGRALGPTAVAFGSDGGASISTRSSSVSESKRKRRGDSRKAGSKTNRGSSSKRKKKT
ncbi:hypothetical protein DIPPA_17731 [Diplonema papillatum]|nr:hypothetical protein DIPPA_17731 [Diplonema papillatum]KAJ9469312.1 hypothetical protein DIPPA_17731 [Diplonema papillatum]